MQPDIVVVRSPDGDEALGPNCLIIAIDETGHEELADPRYPIFGLGGCLTVVGEYHEQIRGPWAAIKAKHFGGSRTPLHATGLKPTPEKAEAIGAFFRSRVFGRFAAITTPATSLLTPLDRFTSTAWMMAHLVTLASAEYSFDRIAVIFEYNARTDPHVRKIFSPTKAFSEEAAKRWKVPTQFFYAFKHMAEPLVEVADFVMQAGGSAVRRNLETGVPFLARKDFAAVFDGGPSRRAAFIRLDSFAGIPPHETTA